MAQKREPSEKQKRIILVVDILAKSLDTENLGSKNWGQVGRLVNQFGVPLIKDCVEKFAKAKTLEERRTMWKSNQMFPYLFGILKKSKVEAERPSAPDIEDILGKDRSM